ncbi:hypothetical protein MtrunA17_Chr3g0099171 [Medicago truncatula]|uniref:Uncharacterized protein n=1 Tax=Medicago truncatula TaxID=3880 RepID=G7IY40_MEDTR|nr:hypothetical protein MTR_3g052520 [Medicago truncatula]RHN67111.1 hypothetical protein MtrunA17_Chr3g0099171 [Medicago truncatula]
MNANSAKPLCFLSWFLKGEKSIMALFFFCCFSESSESKDFVCHGDVCMLRDRKKYQAKKSKSKQKQ